MSVKYPYKIQSINLKWKEKLMSVFEGVEIGNVVNQFRSVLVTYLNLKVTIIFTIITQRCGFLLGSLCRHKSLYAISICHMYLLMHHRSIKIINYSLDGQYRNMYSRSYLACTRLADSHCGSACLPPTLHLHPGPPFVIKVGSDEVFLCCTIVLFHSPSKYVISNSSNNKNNTF